MVFNQKAQEPKNQQTVYTMQQNTEKVKKHRFLSKEIVFHQIGENMDRTIIAEVGLCKYEAYIFYREFFY